MRAEAEVEGGAEGEGTRQRSPRGLPHRIGANGPIAQDLGFAPSTVLAKLNQRSRSLGEIERSCHVENSHAYEHSYR